MKKRIQRMLESKRGDYEIIMKTPIRQCAGGKRGKELLLAQFVAEISLLQDLLKEGEA